MRTGSLRITLWWVHQDSNLGPAGYEPVALTAELWTPDRGYYRISTASPMSISLRAASTTAVAVWDSVVNTPISPKTTRG